MKERSVQVRRFLHEFWWEIGRWTLAFCLISMGLSTVVLWWKFGFYPVIVYICCFFGSLVAAWVLMFRRRPTPREFQGDR